MKVLFFLVLLLSIVGCSVSYEAATINELKQPASQNVDHSNKNGLHVVASELSKQKSVNYFGMDLSEKGYRAILINVENTAENPFKITNDSISIVTEKGDKLSPVPVSEVIDGVKYSHSRAIPFWIIIIPGVFIAPSIHESVNIANEMIEIDYDKKHFKGTLLQSGDQNTGFLFVQNTKDSLSHLLLEVQQQGKTVNEMTQDFSMRIKIVKE